MDYFQGVVTEYLRANRSVFVNTECLIQLEPGDVPAKGRHWYCDAVAANFEEKTAYLCEVTYSSSLHSLVNRLQAWSNHWSDVKAALCRDCVIPDSWSVRPWIFIPQDRRPVLDRKLALISGIGLQDGAMPTPKITYLESATPWRYRTWDRKVDSHEVAT